jgi:peptidoglycan hydrolase-like amidase
MTAKPIILVLAAIISLLWAQEVHADVESSSIFLKAKRTEEIVLEKPATGIAAEIPSGVKDIEIQTLENGKWSNWGKLSIDDDVKTPGERHSNLLFTDSAIKIRLRSQESININLYVVSSSEDATNWEEAAGRSLSPAAVIVPRWQWGANESLRHSKRGAKDIERLFDNRDPFLADKIRNCDRRAFLYPDEFRETDRKFADEEGNALLWPQGYSDKVHMIIIHHTAESTTAANKRTGPERMRTIYEYHTAARKWGDIGYNFVIDIDGQIYEGRAGGDYAVGAHAYCNNVGTMGISLMGNFQTGRPTDGQLTSLRWLTSYLADKYKIDPTGKTIHHGTNMPTIIGHRDVGQTSCPGIFSQELLPQIRQHAKEKNSSRPLFSSVAAQSSQNEAAIMASVDPITLPMGAMQEFDVEFMNVGMDTWNEKTWLLGEGDSGAYLTEYRPYSFIAGLMNEQEVRPGEIGTFTVRIQGGLSEKSGIINLTPVVNNRKRLVNNKVPIKFRISHGNPKYTYVTSYFPPLHKTGEDLTGTVKIFNSGSVPWDRDTITEVQFEIEGGTGEVSVLNHPLSIEPGKQGSFRVRLQNVEEEGKYSRTIIPKFAEGSDIIGNVITVASRAEPIPEIAFSGQSHLAPLPSSRRSRGRETGVDARVEALAGTELTLKPKEQSIIPLRIRAGKNGIRRYQSIAPVVKSNPTITLKPEDGSQRVGGYFKSPISLRRFQTHDMNLIIKAPRSPNNYTFSIGDINFTLKVSGNSNVRMRESTRTNQLSIRTASRRTIVARRAERRSRRIKTAPPPAPKSSGIDDPNIRILLSYTKSNSIFTSPSTLRIEGGGNIIFLDNGPVHITKEHDQCKAITSNGQIIAPHIKLSAKDQNSFVKIMTKPKSTDRYRGVIECRIIDNEIKFINELPLETYLHGLAEEPDTEPYEKQRAFAIAARSYALHYIISGQRKFPGKPWDGSDSPASFQAYGGMVFEERNPRWKDAVKSTASKVLSWERKVVKAPYFSSDNGRTKSALDVWGWEHTPYLNSKDDPWCKGMSNAGHGVGMSGCGSEGQANEGKTAEEILHYYYPGARILPVRSLNK